MKQRVLLLLDRNRNERQKTELLVYASGMIRKHLLIVRRESASVRADKARLSRPLQETLLLTVSDFGAQRLEVPVLGQKKPVKSVRMIPAA